MDAKTKAIVAHITLIGWIVALVMNQNENKDEFVSFYIRQMLGLLIIWFITIWIPVIGWVVWIAAVVFWVISLIGAANGELKLVPILGQHFQEWFKAL